MSLLVFILHHFSGWVLFYCMNLYNSSLWDIYPLIFCYYKWCDKHFVDKSKEICTIHQWNRWLGQRICRILRFILFQHIVFQKPCIKLAVLLTSLCEHSSSQSVTVVDNTRIGEGLSFGRWKCCICFNFMGRWFIQVTPPSHQSPLHLPSLPYSLMMFFTLQYCWEPGVFLHHFLWRAAEQTVGGQ